MEKVSKEQMTEYLERGDNGEVIMMSFQISAWSDDAEKVMKEANKYVKTLLALK